MVEDCLSLIDWFECYLELCLIGLSLSHHGVVGVDTRYYTDLNKFCNYMNFELVWFLFWLRILWDCSCGMVVALLLNVILEDIKRSSSKCLGHWILNLKSSHRWWSLGFFPSSLNFSFIFYLCYYWCYIIGNG